MATKAFQKIYTKITQITKATCSLKATGVGYDELASVDGKLAQVVKIIGDEVTLQVFSGTEGIRTNAEVVFMGKAPSLKVGDQLAGRFFNAYGDPIDGGPVPEGKDVEIGGPSVNPVRRQQPSELIATGIAGIDLNNTLVTGQKIPFFADPDQPFNQVMAMVALRAQSDKIILGGMGMTNDDYLFFKNTFSNAGALDRIVSFINTTEDPSVERILIPDMALCAAEYFAVQKNEKVLVLLTDMTNYADALAIVSNRMDQIPSKDSMPGSLYSDLAKIYEKAVQFPAGGSITIIAVTTLSGGDITHAVPDNTGYITEGQLYLRKDSDVGKVIVDPFRSLSRLKQLVTGKKTREDHPQVMNAAVRLYADAANAKTKMENGGMGMTNDDYLFFKNTFSNAGALDRIVSFINTTEDPSVERILIPDMALCAAEYFAVQKNEKVLVLLTDMTNYADALAIVSNRMDQIPSKDSMPGSLYSDLAKIYEKAVQFPAGGSITIIAVTTLSGGDITHAVPDNTGYITEGQLYLRKDSDVGKVIVDPFRSLSRLKQLVTGKKTREDHPQVMNAAVRLYADAANAKTKMENGFDLTDYDNRTLAFAKDYSEKLLAIDVNLDTTEMLDVAWDLFGEYFEPAEVNIKQALVDKYWKK